MRYSHHMIECAIRGGNHICWKSDNTPQGIYGTRRRLSWHVPWKQVTHWSFYFVSLIKLQIPGAVCIYIYNTCTHTICFFFYCVQGGKKCRHRTRCWSINLVMFCPRIAFRTVPINSPGMKCVQHNLTVISFAVPWDWRQPAHGLLE